MLVALRNKSGNFVVKLLVLFLALSFAVWGIGDIVRGSRPSTVATVDGVKISRSELVRRIQQIFGNTPDREVMQNRFILEQVLQQIVTDKIAAQEASRLGIVASDDLAEAAILKDPVFQKNGKFDKETFRSILSHQGMSEAKYLETLKTSIATNLLLENFYNNDLRPTPAVKALAAARKQQRVIDLAVVPKSAVPAQKAADDATLKKHYEDNILDYTDPELRTISYVTLSPSQYGGLLEPAEIEKAYHARKEEFGNKPFAEVKAAVTETLQREHSAALLQKTANALEDEIAGGATLAEAVAKVDERLTITTLDPVTAQGKTAAGTPYIKLPPFSNFLTVAFSSELKKESPVTAIENGGYFVVRVDDIKPSKPKPFEQVKAEVQGAWQKEAFETAYTEIGKQVVEKLAAGEAIEKIGHGVYVVPAGTLARDSTKAEAGTYASSPLPEGLVAHAFMLDEGKSGAKFMAGDGNYLIPIVRRFVPVAANALEADAKTIETTGNELSQKYQQELLQSYTQHLLARYPVHINDEALAAFQQKD